MESKPQVWMKFFHLLSTFSFRLICVCVFFGENCMTRVTRAVFFKMYQAEFQDISTILRKSMSPMDSPMDSPWIPPKKSLISGATPVRYLYFHRKEADGVTFTELSKGQDADLEAPGQTRKPDGYRMGPPFDSVQLVNITPITMVYNYGLIYSNHN